MKSFQCYLKAIWQIVKWKILRITRKKNGCLDDDDNWWNVIKSCNIFVRIIFINKNLNNNLFLEKFWWNQAKVVTHANGNPTTYLAPPAATKYAFIASNQINIHINAQHALQINQKINRFYHHQEMFLMSPKKEALKSKIANQKWIANTLRTQFLKVGQASIDHQSELLKKWNSPYNP